MRHKRQQLLILGSAITLNGVYLNDNDIKQRRDWGMILFVYN